jgi:hypothetical protein
MYNRILHRPMFKRGGDVMDHRGTGITSGLDNPRRHYEKGEFGEQVESVSEELKISPEQYRSNAWSALGEFASPEGRTLSEKLYLANKARVAGIRPLEKKLSERKFELSKLPLERQLGIDVAKAGIAETATQTRAKHLQTAINILKTWEETNEGEPMPFNLQQEYEGEMILATQGKVTTISEARKIAMEIHNGDGNTDFAKRYAIAVGKKDTHPKYQKIYDRLMAMIDTTSKIILGWSLKRENQATGGRVGYQEGIGPNVMEETASETVDFPGGQATATETMEETLPGARKEPPTGSPDPYLMLRARLPQEIPDDVVRLIAYNPQAFEDFAAIESQEDVVLFNQKYGVELVLPTAQA